MDSAWLALYDDVMRNGRIITTRGRTVRELDHRTVSVNMERVVLTVPERRLNYRFMAAEALWILLGRDDVSFISAFNPNIAQFSDDGKTFTGAYGPRIMPQIPYVVDRLLADPCTRQAALTIWTPSPASSKDIPCTVAMAFEIRDGLLDCHVFMRSSDVWLGLPYDAFNFTMVAAYVMVEYRRLCGGNNLLVLTGLGTLYVTAASSHLYEEHWDRPLTAPVKCTAHDGLSLWLHSLSSWLPGTAPELIEALSRLTDSKRGDPSRWWERTES